MSQLVRVTTEHGEFSCSPSFAKKRGLKVVDKPATRAGRALPAKPRVPKAPPITTPVVPEEDSKKQHSPIDPEGGSGSSVVREEPA